YEDSRKAYRDLKNSLDTAMRDGIKKGRAEGRVEGEKLAAIAIAKKMKAVGLDDDTIMQTTGLSASDLASLCND
ncbi:MAG: hypothetical protein ACI31A_03140, partial [Candidatus Limisoma sp.]